MLPGGCGRHWIPCAAEKVRGDRKQGLGLCLWALAKIGQGDFPAELSCGRDFDDDGQFEYVVFNWPSSLKVYKGLKQPDQPSEMIWSYNFGDDYPNYPIVTDLNNDGQVDIVFTTEYGLNVLIY